MAKTEHYHTRFEPNGVYHVYNRTVDKKPMFRSAANYRYFLERIKKYLLPVADVYAYCLPGNHFHLLIRVKAGPADAAHKTVSDAFKQMFKSYALAFNKQETRVGTLFQTPFKRVAVHSLAYFQYLIWYIHANAQLHGLIADFRDWPHSSYHSLISGKPTLLLRDALLEEFGDREAFIAWHQMMHDISREDELDDW